MTINSRIHLSLVRPSIASVIAVRWAMILALLTLLVSPLLSAADIDGVRLWRAPDHTRVVLDLSDTATFNYFTLKNPDRVVVDIQGAKFKAKLNDLDFSRSP
ncbi:MAG: AMIN domain-containing protein, partial [Pseudomonadales bacterium]